MLLIFLFDLFSQCILSNTMLSFAPGDLFGSGATTVFLGSKPGFFWSSECICICSPLSPFPYLCLDYVTIEGIPALVMCLYGAQTMTPLWAYGLCVGQKVPEGDCHKGLNIVFCSPKRNSCCRSSYLLKKGICVEVSSLHMCVHYQSPSGFVWLFWCVQFLIWCFMVTFLIQGQSPKKDWHLLIKGEVDREMG